MRGPSLIAPYLTVVYKVLCCWSNECPRSFSSLHVPKLTRYLYLQATIVFWSFNGLQSLKQLWFVFLLNRYLMQQYNMSVSCWKKKKKQEEGPIIELNSEYLIVSIVYMVIDFHRTFVKFNVIVTHHAPIWKRLAELHEIWWVING